MEEISVKTNPSPKKCITIASILLIIEIVLIAIIFTIIFTPFGKSLFPTQKTGGHIPMPTAREPFYVYLIPMFIFGIPFLILPALIIAFISDSFNEARIRKHIRFLKFLNPDMNFSNLKRRDINLLIHQLDYLTNLKTGFLTHRKSALGIATNMASAISSDRRSRKELFEVYKDDLKSKHPEINFDNMTTKDRDVIEDELDVLMYSNELK